ncbi:hypothetical protein OWV82_016491 [Melia azedarach]|uniref:Uncharacterized protein n=1 Tax=Melia azedarach TaxID=155640 RepID=A0ACC1XGA5_MELAZ|nr:hypothetical protein OWV82_016491 [Melia azedarach]
MSVSRDIPDPSRETNGQLNLGKFSWSSCREIGNPKATRVEGDNNEIRDGLNADVMVEKVGVHKRRETYSEKEESNSLLLDEVKRLCKKLQEVKKEQHRALGREDDYEVTTPLSLVIMNQGLPKGFKMPNIIPYTKQADPKLHIK